MKRSEFIKRYNKLIDITKEYSSRHYGFFSCNEVKNALGSEAKREYENTFSPNNNGKIPIFLMDELCREYSHITKFRYSLGRIMCLDFFYHHVMSNKLYLEWK